MEPAPPEPQPPQQPRRRGRPRAEDLADRQNALLDAALEELLLNGYTGVTFQGLATRAGVSKETIYSWYGGVDGVFSALIERLADAGAERFQKALFSRGTGRDVLIQFAIGILTLLVSKESIAMNQAAMSSPDLSAVLQKSGRYRLGPLVEGYLRSLDSAGELAIPDPARSFGILYGLIIQDTQIGVLLGSKPPTDEEILARAISAVDDFLTLHATGNPSDL